MKKNLLLVSILSTSCLLAACGGSSGKSESPSITGVWDASEDVPQEGHDERYIAIDSKGSMSVYDYAGDSYDNAGNCYWIYKDVANIEFINGNNYTITATDVDVDDAITSATIDITKASMTITVTAPEHSDPTTHKRTSRHLSDFTPECNDSIGRSQASGKTQNPLRAF